MNVLHIATQSSRAQLGSGAITQAGDAYVNVQVDWENLEINWGFVLLPVVCREPATG